LREQWREALSRNDLAPIRPFLDELLAAKGFVLDPDSIAYRLFAVKSLRAGIKALESAAQPYRAPSQELMRVEDQKPSAPVVYVPASAVERSSKLPNPGGSRLRLSHRRSTMAIDGASITTAFFLAFFEDWRRAGPDRRRHPLLLMAGAHSTGSVSKAVAASTNGRSLAASRL
jgi:hypothetical protein